MSNVKNKKVFCAMSGGVDSSVAAALLKQKGYEVIGAHMKCYNVDGCAEQDAEDARRAAEVLGIPFYVFDFEKEYKEKVVKYMIDGYRSGITPNPDVMCNKEIKFGLFLKKALEMGADYVATGHYVRLGVRGQGSGFSKTRKKSLYPIPYTLYAARDAQKDQSYFLWTLTQDQLRHCLFPIGDYAKPEVRKLAKKFGLPNAEKKDSQGICFLGQVTLKDFLGNYLPQKRGLVLNTAGKVVGEHSGAHFYTIGQRHLGIKNYESGIKGQNERRASYVAEKDIKTNTLLVAEGDDNPALFCKEVILKGVNLINPIIHNSKFMTQVLARVRYRQPLAKAKLILRSSQDLRLVFNKSQKFVASGQSAVFYDDEGRMLGGGVIV
ncbi:MAG: tRNA 2-thiouridine(34) synthase MnmA [Candidatus Harrisonbacteria bacterium]|nr:tRNA 2-thiouridine(34) synthase MnmA [Candidatus Harrisonbacteria bacterium]